MTNEEKKARILTFSRGDGKWIAIDVVSQVYLAVERSESLARDCAIARLNAVK